MYDSLTLAVEFDGVRVFVGDDQNAFHYLRDYRRENVLAGLFVADSFSAEVHIAAGEIEGRVGEVDFVARAENLVASHLLKSVHWWTDAGLGDFALHYLRTKPGAEVDFLVAKEGAPFLLVECKASARESLSPALSDFARRLGTPYAFQVALDAPPSDLDPRELENRPSKIAALDLFKLLV